MLATPCAKSSTFGLCRVAAHPVGDDRGHQRLDRAEHRDRQRRRQQRQDQVGPERGHADVGQARRDAAEPRADRLDRKARQRDDHRAAERARRCARARAARAGSRPGSAPATPTRHRVRRQTTRCRRARRASAIRGRELAGHRALRLRPKKSLICVLAMSTAMPFVKPMTTGRGMNFTAVPMPVAPRTTSMTPAIIVHMNRPSTPCSATMPARRRRRRRWGRRSGSASRRAPRSGSR